MWPALLAGVVTTPGQQGAARVWGGGGERALGVKVFNGAGELVLRLQLGTHGTLWPCQARRHLQLLTQVHSTASSWTACHLLAATAAVQRETSACRFGAKQLSSMGHRVQAGGAVGASSHSLGDTCPARQFAAQAAARGQSGHVAQGSSGTLGQLSAAGQLGVSGEQW